MVKASSAVPLRSSPPASSLSVEEASAALLALINSRPASPRLDEIEAIIGRVPNAGAEPARCNSGLDEWCGILNAYFEESGRPENEPDERADPLLDALCAKTDVIWAKPVRTWDDLVVRAAMAVYWNCPYPNDILRIAIADSNHGYDDYSLAHVVQGILDLAGLTFDPDVYLLSGPNVLGGRHHG
jgi:hypothetical protein